MNTIATFGAFSHVIPPNANGVGWRVGATRPRDDLRGRCSSSRRAVSWGFASHVARLRWATAAYLAANAPRWHSLRTARVSRQPGSPTARVSRQPGSPTARASRRPGLPEHRQVGGDAVADPTGHGESVEDLVESEGARGGVGPFEAVYYCPHGVEQAAGYQ